MKSNHQEKIIFLNAQTQYENLGDLIILKTLLDKLRNYGSLIINELINERQTPEWFSQELDIRRIC